MWVQVQNVLVWQELEYAIQHSDVKLPEIGHYMAAINHLISELQSMLCYEKEKEKTLIIHNSCLFHK